MCIAHHGAYAGLSRTDQLKQLSLSYPSTNKSQRFFIGLMHHQGAMRLTPLPAFLIAPALRHACFLPEHCSCCVTPRHLCAMLEHHARSRAQHYILSHSMFRLRVKVPLFLLPCNLRTPAFFCFFYHACFRAVQFIYEGGSTHSSFFGNSRVVHAADVHGTQNCHSA